MRTLRAVVKEYSLTAGELGAVAAQTVMVTLLPVMLARWAPSSIWIGMAIGGEGVFALALPFWSGAVSDRLPPRVARRFGRRMAVSGAAAVVLAGAVAVTPFLSGYWPLAGAALVAFAGLHAYYTPFWALLIDAVPDERRGRVQGMRGVLRAGGLAYGLVAAGLLFSLWAPLPFLVAAALLLATTGLTWRAARSSDVHRQPAARGRLHDAWRELLRNRPAFWILAADACWNAAVDGIRPYFFLYADKVLGTTVAETSIGLTLLVGGLALGSWLVGRLGDRRDRLRLLELSSLALAGAFAVGFFARSVPVTLAVAAAAGLAAAAIMTLPYPLFAAAMGEGHDANGENTGMYAMSATIGRVVAPLLVGAVIDLGARFAPRTGGYPFMWLVSAALAAGGYLCVRRAARLRAAAPAAGGAGADWRAPPATSRGEPS
jgi:MFS family permease